MINTGNRWVNYTAGDTRDKLNIISNMLSVKQEIPLFHVDLKLSHSYSESRSPETSTSISGSRMRDWTIWRPDEAAPAGPREADQTEPRDLVSG